MITTNRSPEHEEPRSIHQMLLLNSHSPHFFVTDILILVQVGLNLVGTICEWFPIYYCIVKISYDDSYSFFS